MQHLALEWGEIKGRCRTCNTKTLLVTADCWHTHPEGEADDADDFVEPLGEVSGHYCPSCHRLTAVFLNGQEP